MAESIIYPTLIGIILCPLANKALASPTVKSYTDSIGGRLNDYKSLPRKMFPSQFSSSQDKILFQTHHSLLKNLVMQFLTPSWKTQTTLFVLSFYHPFYLMNCKAVYNVPPDDPPTKSPSFLISFLARVNEPISQVLTQWSTQSLWHVLGTKSYPTPSTLYVPPGTFRTPGMAKILPIGSAPTIKVFGLFSLIFLEIPAIVPPVPTPITTASKCPSV